jgi:5-formyltetrahydrofolate cyclo-ligase
MVVPSLHPSMSKPELRAAMRATRKAFVTSLSIQQREALQSALATHLRPLIERSAAVGGYHAVGSEIDPAPALALAEQAALPTFDEAEELFLFRLGPATATGPHGIPQPTGDAAELSCALILVPLLAIDPRGHRLGQGGGHYDRVLPALREAGAVLIGVGWDMQRLDFELPHEPWDVPLDGFASPSGVEMFR